MAFDRRGLEARLLTAPPTSIMSMRARTSRLTLSRPTSVSSSPSTSFEFRADVPDPSAPCCGSGAMARCSGSLPTRPGAWTVACTAVSGAAAAPGVRTPALSSLVQSSTTGPVPEPASAPASANSYPPRAHRSVRHLRSVVRLPSITWKP